MSSTPLPKSPDPGWADREGWGELASDSNPFPTPAPRGLALGSHLLKSYNTSSSHHARRLWEAFENKASDYDWHFWSVLLLAAAVPEQASDVIHRPGHAEFLGWIGQREPLQAEPLIGEGGSGHFHPKVGTVQALVVPLLGRIPSWHQGRVRHSYRTIPSDH